MELKQQGISILLVEQNLNMALHLADQVYIVNKGQIVYAGSPAELAENSDAQTMHLGVGH